MKEAAKKGIIAGGMGLNAAAIIFLYTNFVPRVEYEKLHAAHDKHLDKYELLSQKVVVQEATLNVYRGMIGNDFD